MVVAHWPAEQGRRKLRRRSLEGEPGIRGVLIDRRDEPAQTGCLGGVGGLEVEDLARGSLGTAGLDELRCHCTQLVQPFGPDKAGQAQVAVRLILGALAVPDGITDGRDNVGKRHAQTVPFAVRLGLIG